MSPDTAQRIFSATDVIIEELNTVDRLTLKDVSTRISTQTGLSMAVVGPVVQMYVKNRNDLILRKGRNGGIKRRPKDQAIEADTAEIVEVESKVA